MTHLAESDWHQYHCATEVTSFIQNLLQYQWTHMINFILFKTAGNWSSVLIEITASRTIFKNQWKKVLNLSSQWDALCNPTLSRFVSPTSSPTPCAIPQRQLPMLLPGLSVSPFLGAFCSTSLSSNAPSLNWQRGKHPPSLPQSPGRNLPIYNKMIHSPLLAWS